MKIFPIFTLFLTLAACQTPGHNSGNDYANEYDVMGPDYDMSYPDEGVSFKFGGSISTDAYLIHKKGKAQ